MAYAFGQAFEKLGKDGYEWAVRIGEDRENWFWLSLYPGDPKRQLLRQGASILVRYEPDDQFASIVTPEKVQGLVDKANEGEVYLAEARGWGPFPTEE
jgi:hypothetical protein